MSHHPQYIKLFIHIIYSKCISDFTDKAIKQPICRHNHHCHFDSSVPVAVGISNCTLVDSVAIASQLT